MLLKNIQKMISYMHSVLVVVLTFGIGLLPPFGQITPLGMQILGVFIGTLYGWCTVGMMWPSLLALIAIGSTSYCTVKEAFMAGFGNDIVIIIVCVFILGAYLEESGLSKYMANWFISRKIGEGRPWVFTILLFAAAYVLSAFVSLYATIIIIWGIFYQICELTGIKKQSSYAAMVIAGIVIICSLTGNFFPFQAFGQVMLGLVKSGTGQAAEVDFMSWFLFNFIVSIILIAAYLIAARFILKPNVQPIKEAGQKFAYLRQEKMDKTQKTAALVLVLFILSQIMPSFMPRTWLITSWLNNLGIMGGVTICMIALMILKNKEGEPIANIAKLIRKGVNWELVVLMAATVPLSSALEAEETGVLATVIAWMTSKFSGLSAVAFLAVIIVLFLLVTQFAHNLILMIVLTPILAKMGLSFGIEPLVVASLIYFTAQSAFLTPASSSQAALIFGNTEWVSQKYAYSYGALYIVIALVIMIFCGIPLAQFFLG